MGFSIFPQEEDDFLPKETVIPDVVPSPDFTSGKSADFMHYGISPGFKNL